MRIKKHSKALLFSVLILFAGLNLFANNEGPIPRADLLELRINISSSARQFLGSVYKYGSCGEHSFDCSGLVKKVFNDHGVNVARRAEDQAKEGRLVSLNELKAGDLVFFGKGHNKVDHVAIVIRKSKRNLVVIHSTSSGGVMLDDIMFSNYWKKKLLFGVDILSEKI